MRNPAVRVNCVLPGPVMLPPDRPEAERAEAIAATLVKRRGDAGKRGPGGAILDRQRFRDRDLPAGRRRALYLCGMIDSNNSRAV